VALACLSVIAMIVAGLIRLAAARADRLDAAARLSQADWLVEAGLERSSIRLRSDPSYDGEAWEVPAEALGGRSGLVVIAVEPGDEAHPTSAQTVRIRADYPSDGDPSHRVRRSKVFQVRPNAGIDGGES
jgi:hypothetical protein